jgi:hypothetical protein
VRLVIIQGSENGKSIDLPIERLRQSFSELEITKNDLPYDGVAIFDCAMVNRLDKNWAREKPFVLGLCEHTGDMKVEQGPTTGDFVTAAMDRISRGELDEPPEENAGLTMG